MTRTPKEYERDIKDEPTRLEGKLSGFCPVQGVGTVAGHRFYFRARHDSWTFAVSADRDVDPVDIQLPGQGFRREGSYTQSDAGWMPLDEAEAIIRNCVREYLGRDI